jgi:RNA 2',3'-cyclic 3'-phosphodiesterase
VSDERARLFVALELPDDVRRALARWRERAVQVREITGVRLVAAEDLHVTLCFLGWRWVRDVDAIASACRVVAAEPVAALRSGEPLWLPRRRPRVLTVSLEDLDGALGHAQALLSDALAARGWYEPEARPFLAHVTVARLGRGAPVRCPELTAPRGPTFEGSRVTLYRSRLSPAGAKYEALASVELTG